MKILIIDDSSDTLGAISLCLQTRWPDAEILTAQTGVEGLIAVGQHSPDIVILDVGLPDVKGIDVLAGMKTLDVPVLMLSAYDQVAGMMTYIERGADQYLVKPCPPGLLVASVEALWQKRTAGKPSSTGIDDSNLGGVFQPTPPNHFRIPGYTAANGARNVLGDGSEFRNTLP